MFYHSGFWRIYTTNLGFSVLKILISLLMDLVFFIEWARSSVNLKFQLISHLIWSHSFKRSLSSLIFNFISYIPRRIWLYLLLSLLLWHRKKFLLFFFVKMLYLIVSVFFLLFNKIISLIILERYSIMGRMPQWHFTIFRYFSDSFWRSLLIWRVITVIITYLTRFSPISSAFSGE